MDWRRKIPALAALIALLGGLSGCGGLPGLTFNPQELYVLPELPAKYTELSGLLGDILGDGAEYAAPTSGANIQPVQMVDLDGDDRQEAVAFFRSPGDGKPLKIYVFTAEGDGYRLTDLIEGSGTAIYSVDYKDLDGDGNQEIAVGWKAAAELQVLEVYAREPDGAHPLVRTDYVKYAIADLDGDGRQGLIVLRASEDGDGIAEYYSWQEDGTLSSRSPARITATMAELSQQGRVSKGALRGGSGALFVTSVTDQQMAVTDILALRGGELVNIVLGDATGVSGEIVPFASLYPTDINSDGVTEVPRPVNILAPWGEESRLIEWRDYDERGVSVPVMRTYHDRDGGWYLRLPAAWGDRIYASRGTPSAGESSITFSIRGETQMDSRPVLRISALTGSGREMRAVRGDRFILKRQSETIYTGELLEGNHNWEFGTTEEEVRSSFSVILPEWMPGDN